MTKKRFKKLLMGQYKFSRNRAEVLSHECPRTIEKTSTGILINGHIHIFRKPLKFAHGTKIEEEFAAYYNSELHFLFQSNAPIGGDES